MVQNKEKLDLHGNKQRTLCAAMFFTFVFLILEVCSFFLLKTDFRQLYSIQQSSYVYSGMLSKPIDKDGYHRFQADIYFALSAEAKVSLNAEILMQSKDAVYSDELVWNTDILGDREVAISSGLADKYGLHQGDILYSRNLVYGDITEYKIHSIIPLITTARVQENRTNIDGLIIMGEDNAYIENLVSQFVVYTDVLPNQIYNEYKDMPIDLLYRRTEKTNVIMRIIPYCIFLVGISMIFAFGYGYALVKNIKYNFLRLIILGYSKESVDSAFDAYILRSGFAGALVAFALALVTMLFMGGSGIEVVIVLAMFVLEVITLLVSTRYMRKRLWRNL